jgi:hypothetical protein
MQAEKDRLIRLLDATRHHTRIVLQRADPERVVHPDTGWRVKDVVGHILVWEEEALRAVSARQSGETYTIPDFQNFDDYNQADFEQRRKVPFDQLLADLESVREQLKRAILDLPPDRLEGRMDFPWPGSGTFSTMIEIMAFHEDEHCAQIEQAM